MKLTHEELHASRPGYPPMAVHAFTIATERKTGADLASCGRYSARSLKSCAARKLARAMIDAGEPDGPVEAWNGGRLSYTVRSLVAFGKSTLVENPRLQRIPWRASTWFADSAGSGSERGLAHPDARTEARSDD